MLAFSLLALAACAPSVETAPAVVPGSPEGVAVPVDELPAKARCLVDRGFRVVKVQPPQAEWDEPSYVFQSDLPLDQAKAAMDDCTKLYPTPPKTDEEISAIYDRWVGERACLVKLGYQPLEPPSRERFIADWRTPKGPWMPTDGVDTAAWTGAEYEQVKRECILEMFDRG